MWRFVLLAVVLSVPVFAEHPTNAYFGDLHVHTKYSFDAYIFGTTTGPDDAYKFAKGERILHAGGQELKLSRPLDFYAVTDHAMYLGYFNAMESVDHPAHDDTQAQFFLNLETLVDRNQAFNRVFRYLSRFNDLEASRSAWQAIIDAANRHYEPGEFTTFIGYEWTASYPGDRGNLHRNVIFEGDSAPQNILSRRNAINPEKLWEWMDKQREDGYEVLAIPHNSNGSNGHMFELTAYGGEPITKELVESRLRNEPIVEITQIKGTSDTHPYLSPNDEWAYFEIYPYIIASNTRSSLRGSYVREALRNGLEIEDTVGANPFRFGLIVSSYTHNSGETFEESNFLGKVGLLDVQPSLRGSVPMGHDNGFPGYHEGAYQYMSSSGLAGVWAQENTRESIFAAMKRKETFATSGPRIQVRFFAGYGYDEDILQEANFVSNAYEGGVPMGGALGADGDSSPIFVVWALQDPLGDKLQRVQIIKGWQTEDGETDEKVYDVACSDGLRVNPKTNRCPSNRARVDVDDCSTTSGVGASDLRATWTDPEYDPNQKAFYYVRVLENPVCRWSTWDAIRDDSNVRPTLRQFETIQERAWSSPIWIDP